MWDLKPWFPVDFPLNHLWDDQWIGFVWENLNRKPWFLPVYKYGGFLS
jgi:hypothetical protein